MSNTILPVNNLDDLQEQLKAIYAQRITYKDIPGQALKEISRHWPDVSADYMADAVLFLNQFTDVANSKPQYWIKNPVIDKIEYQGTWRNAGSMISREATGIKGIVQTLRFGWATSIIWTEAFLDHGQNQTTKERELNIVWRNIDPAKVDDCVTPLLAIASYTDPIIQGETFSGTWAMGNVKPKQQDDGTFIIELDLVYVTAVTGIPDLAGMTPYREYIHDVNHPHGEAGGYTAHIGKSYTDGIILRYVRITTGSKDAINALTDAQFQGDTTIGTPPNDLTYRLLSTAEQATYEFVRKDLKEDLDLPVLNLELVYKRVGRIPWTLTTIATPGAMMTPNLVHYEGVGTLWEKRTNYFFGITRTSTTATVGTGAASKLQIIADITQNATANTPGNIAGYQVIEYHFEDNDDGSMTVVQVQQYARTLPATLVATDADIIEPKNSSKASNTLPITGDTNAGWVESYFSYRPNLATSETIKTAIDRGIDLLAAVGAAQTGYFFTISVTDRHNGIFDFAIHYYMNNDSWRIYGFAAGWDTADGTPSDTYYCVRRKDGQKRIETYVVYYCNGTAGEKALRSTIRDDTTHPTNTTCATDGLGNYENNLRDSPAGNSDVWQVNPVWWRGRKISRLSTNDEWVTDS